MEFKVGQKIPTNHMKYIKVMAIAEGYIMARYSGCIPFCDSIENFRKKVEENKLQITNPLSPNSNKLKKRR